MSRQPDAEELLQIQESLLLVEKWALRRSARAVVVRRAERRSAPDIKLPAWQETYGSGGNVVLPSPAELDNFMDQFFIVCLERVQMR